MAVMMWAGDGFSLGSEQVGKKVDIKGKTGVITEATDLTVIIRWDRWWWRLKDWIDYIWA